MRRPLNDVACYKELQQLSSPHRFDSCGIRMRDDRAHSASASTINSPYSAKVNSAKIAFNNWNIQSASKEASPVKGQPPTYTNPPIPSALNSKATQIFSNCGVKPQTNIFTHLTQPSKPVTKKTSPPLRVDPDSLGKPLQQNTIAPNNQVNTSKFQCNQNGITMKAFSVGNNGLQDSSTRAVQQNNPPPTLNIQPKNNLIPPQNQNKVGFAPPSNNNIQVPQTVAASQLQPPRQNAFSLNNPPSQHNLFAQPPRTNKLPSQINNSPKPGAKPKFLTNANTLSNNTISLDQYFPNTLSNTTSVDTPSQGHNYYPPYQPVYVPIPPPPPPPRFVPSLFDPNYPFQYVSDPVLEREVELQMEEETVQSFIAKSLSEMGQVYTQLQQLCNKSLQRLKERGQIQEMNELFTQVSKFIKPDAIVSQELDTCEAKQLQIEGTLDFIQKAFPPFPETNNLSIFLEDSRQLELKLRALDEQQEDSFSFRALLLLYETLDDIDDRVKQMNTNLDDLSIQQQ